MAVDLDPELLPLCSSPLHVVANSNDTKSLTLLLHSLPDLDSSIDAQDRHGRTPLAIALQNGRFGTARILIEYGANIDSISLMCVDREPVSQVLSCSPYIDFIEALIEDRVKLPLHIVVKIPLIFSAAYEGRVSFLESYLEQYECNVDSKDHIGCTALHYASQRGELSCVELLVKYGASTRLTNPQGMTPLHLACASGHQDVVEMLLLEWVTPDPQVVLNVKDFHGRTPLHVALYCKQFQVFKYLATKYLALFDLDASDSAGYTVPFLLFICKFKLGDGRYKDLPIISSEEATWILHEGVAESNINSVVSSIACGAWVNAFDFMQQSPLILASKIGSLDICRALIESGADPNAHDEVGSTALQYACRSSHCEVAEYLLSLPNLDVELFYNRYNDPLSPEVLYTLVRFFAGCNSSKKPLYWCKWITLAAQHPKVDREAFNALINEVCPSDWLTQLSGRGTSVQTQDSRVYGTTPQSFLPTMVVLPPKVDEKNVGVPKKGKKKHIPLRRTKLSPPVVKFVAKKQKKTIPKTKWFQEKPKPFQFHFEHVGYFPLHEAVIHKNIAVFGFILSKAVNSHHPDLIKQLLTGVKDNSNQTVIDHLGRNFQAFKLVLEELQLTKFVKKYLIGLYPLPEGISVEMALLHYLMSGGPQSVHRVTLARRSKTPVDQWPQWYLELILLEYCNDELGFASDIISLYTEEGRVQLAVLLLNSEHVHVHLNDTLRRNRYPCLLYTSVMNGCNWAVELLLQRGVSPLAKFRERYAIVVAAEHCKIEIINLILPVITQNHLDGDQLQSLSESLPSGLVSLANRGHSEIAERLVGVFALSSSLWSSGYGPRLLYVLLSLELGRCSDCTTRLLQDVASFFCQKLIEKKEFPFHKHLQIYLPFLNKLDHSHHQFVQFVKFCLNPARRYYSYDLVFHSLCGAGEYDLVLFVLDTLSDSNTSSLLNKPDSNGRSPLFYAAFGGHARVVQLLVERGSVVFSEGMDPPIKGLLMYLVLSPYTNCLGEDFVTSQAITRATRRKSFKQLYSFSPEDCSFDSELFSNPQDMAQLASLLLPSPDQWENVLSKDCFQIVTMLSTIQNLDPFEELLFNILAVVQKSSFVFDISVEDLRRLGLFVNVFDVLPDTKSSEAVSWADVAVCLVPYSASSSPRVRELHDNILASCTANNCLLLEALSTAAEKRYWGLVMNVLPNILSEASYSTFHLQKHLSIVWYQAAIDGQQTIFDAFHDHVFNLPTLVTAAVKHNQLHLVELFTSDSDCLCSALIATVRFNSMQTFSLLLNHIRTVEPHKIAMILNALVIESIRWANQVCLKSLQDLYQDPSLDNKTEFPDKNLSFWFLVLCQAVKFGNEEFGLQSVKYISNSQMELIANHDRYLDIVSGCCYWGMVDLFEYLPVTTEQLFQRPTPEVACPWENAAANGYIGKMSASSVFPSLSEAVAKLPDSPELSLKSTSVCSKNSTSLVALSLFCGVLDKLLHPKSLLSQLSVVPKYTMYHKQISKCGADCLGILVYTISEGLADIVHVILDHLGKYAGDVIHFIEIKSPHNVCSSILYSACSKPARKDNDAVLEMLLSALTKSELLLSHLEKESYKESSSSVYEECLKSTVQKGSVKCTQLLLRYASSTQLSIDFKKKFRHGDTLLHLAVHSKTPEMVDLILSLLHEDAPKSCFEMNQYEQCPLYVAFALGCTSIIHDSSLVVQSSKSVKFQELEECWYSEAFLAHGWFHSMMLTNSTGDTNAQSCTYSHTTGHTEINIRDSTNVWNLLNKAAEYQDHVLVQALVSSTPCALMLKSSRSQLLLRSMTYVPFQMLKQVGLNTDSGLILPTLMEIIAMLDQKLNYEDILIQALDEIPYDYDHASFIKETFHMACALHKMKVVKHLLRRSDEVVVIQVALIQDRETLEIGLGKAILHGCFDIAAYLQLTYNLSFDMSEFSDLGVSLPDLTLQIFSNRTYYQLLESFFDSTVKSASDNATRGFCLSAAWLAHHWTEEEAMLIMKKVGGTSGTNPWLITVPSDHSGQRQLSLHVDWDSFSECLLHSPLIDSPTSKYRYTPLLAEACVFSPVILGELIHGLQHSKLTPSKPTSFDSFSISDDSSLSSVILSCDTWPAKPSFVSMNSGEQGILSLSYNPSEGVFLFPDTAMTELNTSSIDSVSSEIDDSGIQYSFERASFILPSDVSHYYCVQIRRVFHNKVKAYIEISENLLDSTLYSCLLFCLDDCISALRLVQKPAVRYSHAIPDLHAIGIEVAAISRTYFELCLKKIDIYVNLAEHQSVRASCHGDVLTIKINIAWSANADFPIVPSFESLLETITSTILTMEIEKDKQDFKKSISVKVLPKLKKSLKFSGSLDQDLLSLAVRDSDGHSHMLETLTPEYLVHVKSLVKLKKFLSLFFKILHVLSFRPRLQTNVRSLFEAGFRIFLTSSGVVSYGVKAHVPHLTISCESLLNGSYRESLLDTLRSLVETTAFQRRSFTLKDFANQVPAPFLCYIDLRNSSGFLYPVVQSKSSILVQLVDYDNQPLLSRPTINCVVKVTVISPTSKTINLTFKDSECAVASSSNKQIVVCFTSTGEIQLDWTPAESGLYRIFISINSIPIKGSPFKSWCSKRDHTKNTGTRKSIAGFPLTFIAEHNHLKPQCNYHCTGNPLVYFNYSKDSKDKLNAKVVQAESSQGLHHISVSADFEVKNYSSNWFQIRAQTVTLHISTGVLKDYFSVQCNPLSNGMYSIVLQCTRANTFKMFVSCPICQSVLKIHWVDQTTFLPSICYILPGIVSPTSTLKYVAPRKQEYSAFKDYEVKAGSTVAFTITARDVYGNAHTSGGAINTVSITNAGQRNLRENMTWSELQRAVSRQANDVTCNVTDHGNGKYTVTGKVYTFGNHSIVMTTKYSSVKHYLALHTLRVTSGQPFAPYCHFPVPGELMVSKKFICPLVLNDKYMNPCDSPRAHQQVRATMGGVALESMSRKQAGQRRLTTEIDLSSNTIILYLVPQKNGQQELLVHVNGVLHPSCPITLNVIQLSESFSIKFQRLRRSLKAVYCVGATPTLTVDRSDILESSLRIFTANRQYFKKVIKIRFGEEVGIDAGGVSNEFFHLLSLEFVNPQYALFSCVNGLYKPSPNSSVNTNHLVYFGFFGKMLAKAICDGHQVTVRFTPAVYKYLLGLECSLDDLKIEDPSLHKGLFEIMDSKSEEDLEQLADNFTTVKSHFGALHTIELELGGENRKVTMANRHDFVQKLFTWHLTGCIEQQLGDLKKGFNSLISVNDLKGFSAHELEVILSGQPTIDIEFIKGRTEYAGFTGHSRQIEWLWEVLKSFTQEQRCQFLQFTTGCACLPTADMGQWKLTVKQGTSDSSLLPQAATCFNSITLSVYPSKNILKSKLELAISYGQQTFLNY